MQLRADVDTFEKYQQAMVREIIEQIRFKLAAAGYRGDELRDITGEIAFSVASTLDDNAGIDVDGMPVKPYITFKEDDIHLVHCGENSYMHEYVAGLVFDIFGK